MKPIGILRTSDGEIWLLDIFGFDVYCRIGKNVSLFGIKWRLK